MTDTFQFEIKHRASCRVLFTADLAAEHRTNSWGLQIGAAVRIAVSEGADLSGAYLAGAYLAGARLAGANLARANLAGADLSGAYGLSARIIDGGVRSDGHRFLLARTAPGEWRVKAGCRNFTVQEARDHWTEARGGTPLGNESLAIVEHMVAIAKIREWSEQGEDRPESEGE